MRITIIGVGVGLTVLLYLITIILYVRSIIIHCRIVSEMKDNRKDSIKFHYGLDFDKTIIWVIGAFIIVVGYLFSPMKDVFVGIIRVYLGAYLILHLPAILSYVIGIKISDSGVLTFGNLIQWENLVRYELLTQKSTEEPFLKLIYTREGINTFMQLKIKKKEEQIIQNAFEKHGYFLID